MNTIITLSEYLKDPCGTLSVPYWKEKRIKLPDDMLIVHNRDFSQKYKEKYNDEKYFRLYHDMKSIACNEIEGIELSTASLRDMDTIVAVINKCYDDISVTPEQMLEYTKTPVYNESLWILAIDKANNRCAGAGIADYDKEARELILEWIQVLPDYQGRKIGQAIVNELLNRMKDTAKFATVSGKVDNATKPELLYRKCGFEGNDVWHILQKKCE